MVTLGEGRTEGGGWLEDGRMRNENIYYIPINPLQKLIRGMSACQPFMLL